MVWLSGDPLAPGGPGEGVEVRGTWLAGTRVR